MKRSDKAPAAILLLIKTAMVKQSVKSRSPRQRWLFDPFPVSTDRLQTAPQAADDNIFAFVAPYHH